MEGTGGSSFSAASGDRSKGKTELNPNASEWRSLTNDRSSQLNPNASEWSLTHDGSPQELRTIFITFSKSQPVDESEIAGFFNRNYGECVERVTLFSTSRNNPPSCGRVLFRYASVPTVILGRNYNDDARFKVNGKPLWCMKYDPTNGYTNH